MDTHSADVTQVVPISFTNSDESVMAVFTYCAADPYAVNVIFTTIEGDSVWTFARDLLLDGLTHDTGEGDIRVGPSGPGHIYLDLRTPDGAASLLCDREALTELVDQMFRLVPEHQEWPYLQIDSWVAELTS